MNTGALIPLLVTLDTDLGLHGDVKSACCINDFVDKDYPELKALVRESALHDGKLVSECVDRIESLGMSVTLDKVTGQLAVYLNNGHFTVN